MSDRKQYFADYYQKNKEKIDARTYKYYRDNPEVKLMANWEYRKKKKLEIK